MVLCVCTCDAKLFRPKTPRDAESNWSGSQSTWSTIRVVSTFLEPCCKRHWVTLWWTKKSHFQPSVESSRRQLVRYFSTILCSPNEDFGRLNKALRMHFWTSFQSVVAQNEYSHPWKVLQKRTRNALFSRPKSSFGEHKSPFWTFRQKCRPGFVVNTFVEMFRMEIVEK